jgi:hypothetical protein
LQPDTAGFAPAFRVSLLRAPAEAHLPDNLETLCHLVETRAAKHGIVRLYLWEWALIAVRDGLLPYKVSGVWKNVNPLDDAIEDDQLSSQHLPSERPPSEHEHRTVRAKAGWYLADKRDDPFQSWWWKQLLIAPEAFDKWLKEQQSPEKPTGRRGSRGPEKGMVGRYLEADRALFAAMEELIPKEGSVRAAALQLAWHGKIMGKGTEENRAKRLERRYFQHKKLGPTKSR